MGVTVMKVTYTFDSENENDLSDLKIFQKAPEMMCVIHEVYNEIRTQLKHGEHDEKSYAVLERLYDTNEF